MENYFRPAYINNAIVPHSNFLYASAVHAHFSSHRISTLAYAGKSLDRSPRAALVVVKLQRKAVKTTSTVKFL